MKRVRQSTFAKVRCTVCGNEGTSQPGKVHRRCAGAMGSLPGEEGKPGDPVVLPIRPRHEPVVPALRGKWAAA